MGLRHRVTVRLARLDHPYRFRLLELRGVQSFRYVGWNTAEPKLIRSLKNFGTCSEPYTTTYAFLAVYSSSACHWLATRVQLRRRHGVELLQLLLDVRIVDVAEVLVVGRLDRIRVQQQVEVDGFGKSWIQSAKPVCGSVFALPIVGKYVASRDDLRRRLEAELVEQVGVVLDVLACAALRSSPQTVTGWPAVPDCCTSCWALARSPWPSVARTGRRCPGGPRCPPAGRSSSAAGTRSPGAAAPRRSIAVLTAWRASSLLNGGDLRRSGRSRTSTGSVTRLEAIARLRAGSAARATAAACRRRRRCPPGC